MVRVNEAVELTEIPQAISSVGENEGAMKLVAEMLTGHIVDIRPQLKC